MYGGEGMEVAERFNDWGITAFVLTYRLSPRTTTRRAPSTASAPFSSCGPGPPNGSWTRQARFRRFLGGLVARAARSRASAPAIQRRGSDRPRQLAARLHRPGLQRGRATPSEISKTFRPRSSCAAARPRTGQRSASCSWTERGGRQSPSSHLSEGPARFRRGLRARSSSTGCRAARTSSSGGGSSPRAARKRRSLMSCLRRWPPLAATSICALPRLRRQTAGPRARPSTTATAISSTCRRARSRWATTSATAKTANGPFTRSISTPSNRQVRSHERASGGRFRDDPGYDDPSSGRADTSCRRPDPLLDAAAESRRRHARTATTTPSSA